jgi:uncharacterized delta-60 repeat protein
VALQPNGRIVAAGINSVGDFAVARYQSSGSPDLAFSGDGQLTTDFGGFDLAAGAIAIQPDGGILVGGGTEAVDQNFALARYTTAGVLDTGFDGDGLVTTDFSHDGTTDAWCDSERAGSRTARSRAGRGSIR